MRYDFSTYVHCKICAYAITYGAVHGSKERISVVIILIISRVHQTNDHLMNIIHRCTKGIT